MPAKDMDRRRAWAREYYAKNPEKPKADAKRRRAKQRPRLREYLDEAKSGPCLDCGGTFPPCAMDFDHVRGEKLLDVGRAVASGWSLEKIDEEIAKCELVCANCHRVRTYNRLMEAIREGKEPDLDDMTLF